MDNNTDEQTKLLEANDQLARDLIPAMVFLAVLMVLGIVGNLLVCFIFFFRLRMGTQDYLIIALAVFDLLSCFIAMPTEIADMRFFLMFDNEFACRLLRFINSYCAFGSILTLIVIAVDRFMKVCHPLRRQMSLLHVKMALLLVLLVALIFAFPAAILYGIRTTDLENLTIHGHDCSTNDSVKDTVYPLAYNTILFVMFFIILVTLSVIYVRIWREMKRHRLYMARNSVVEGSQIYLPSVSEASSGSEFQQAGRGRQNSLAADHGNDEVFVDFRQERRGGGKSDVKKKDGKNSDFSQSDRSQDRKFPSVPSDTTLCEVEQNVRVEEQGEREVNEVEHCLTEVNRVERGLNELSEQDQSLKEMNTPQQSVKELSEGGQGATQVSESHQGVNVADCCATEASGGVQEGCKIGQDVKKVGQTGRGVRFSLKPTSVISADSPDFDGLTYSVSEVARSDFKRTEDSINDVLNLSLASVEPADIRRKDLTNGVSHSDQTSISQTETDGEKAVNCVCDIDARVIGESVVCGGQVENITHPAKDLNTAKDLKGNGSVDRNCVCSRDSTSAIHPHTPAGELTESSDIHTALPDSQTQIKSASVSTCSENKSYKADTALEPSSQSKTEIDNRASGDFHSTDGVFCSSCQPTAETVSSKGDVPNMDAVLKTSSLSEPDTASPENNSHSTNAPTTSSTQPKTDSVRAESNGLNNVDIAKCQITRTKSVSEVKSHKATIIAMSVTVVFFLSFVPHLSLITVRTINTQFDRNLRGAALVFYNIFLRSYFINSVSNPIIYGVLNARFRAECLRVFRQVVACKKKFRM